MICDAPVPFVPSVSSGSSVSSIPTMELVRAGAGMGPGSGGMADD
jgi:hypothetical protein